MKKFQYNAVHYNDTKITVSKHTTEFNAGNLQATDSLQCEIIL